MAPAFSRMQECLLLECTGDRSAVIISESRAVTYRHGSHKAWKVGTVIDYLNKIDGKLLTVQVEGIDEDADFIVLSGEFSRFPQPASDEVPCSYWTLSHSGLHNTLSCSTGVIASYELSSKNYIIGTAGGRKGDSGGGVFTKTGAFLGMVIGTWPEVNNNNWFQEFNNCLRTAIVPAGVIRKFCRRLDGME